MRPRNTAPRVSEKAEQQHIVQLLLSIGAAVYVLGHPSPNDGRRHRGTGQTPGVPDLLAFLPWRAPLDGLGIESLERQVWIEVKAAGGKLRPEQETFRERCEKSGVAHVIGGLDAVIAWLAERGYVKASAFPHYRQPKGAA